MRQLLYRGLFLQVMLVNICCLSVRAQKGSFIRLSDNTFGSGGTKINFRYNNLQLDILSDANNNRREIIYNYNYSGLTDFGKTTDYLYFDCNGKKQWFNSFSYNPLGTQVQGIEEKFSNGIRIGGSAWTLSGGNRLNYTFNSGTKNYIPTNIYNDPGDFKPNFSKCPKPLYTINFPKFDYNITGNNHYNSETDFNEYPGGKLKIDAYLDDGPDLDDIPVETEERDIYDVNGVLRHSFYREWYEDDCMYEEETYYDCNGKPIYFTSVLRDGYDGYPIEIVELNFVDGKPVSGYRDVDDEEESFRDFFDPATNSFRPRRILDFLKPIEFVPPTGDCPKGCNYSRNEFYLGPSVIREDDGGDGFYMFGGQFSFTRNICWRGGLTGDIGVNFGDVSGVKYTKLNILAGGLYYPFRPATLCNEFNFSVHALAGIGFVRSEYGGNSNSNSAFTMDLGIGLNKYFNDRFGLGIRAGYLPSFGEGNTSNNFRIGAGIVFR